MLGGCLNTTLSGKGSKVNYFSLSFNSFVYLEGQKIPNLKQPLLEPKTYTPRSTKSASFSDSRSGPLYGHKDNFDGGLPWKSKSSSFSGTQSRLKDKTDSKNEENCLNKGEDTNEKGAGVVYRQNHAGTVPATVPKSTNIRCDESKKSEINPKLAISKGRNSNTNTMTNILNTAHALETKQHEIEASDVKNLHSQHEGENYVMSRQNNNDRPALRNRDITGIISELETRRSSNREYDDKVSELTSCEVQISENNSVLCLLHKHAFAIKENVKMTVDLQNGFLVISGEDETDVREVENVARCKLDTVRTKRLFLPEYQVPFVQKDGIQGLINETLEHRHICCYWKLEECYISVTAWENETVTDWCRMYKELFHSRELDIFHDQGSTKKLVSLSRSQYWEVIEKSVKVKYGDLFSVKEFSKDGRRYLGVIAPRQIFDKIWDELEMAVKRFEPFVEAYSLNKQTSQKTDILKTYSGSYEKFEEDERIILEKIEIGFNEDQTAHQAEKHIVDVEALNSVAKQVQITECIQMPNFNNHKIKSTEENAASQQLISEIHDKEKRSLGEESEYQLGAENDVGGRATETLDYNSATKLQKNIEHEFETDKVNKQVKESKKINTVHWTGETCEEKTRDKVHICVGQRTNQIKDDDIEHGAATYPFQSCKHDGQQATRCMDSDNELVVEKQNKDVDSIKEVIKDSNISHEAGSTSENNFVINTQVGHQLKRSRDNEIKLENGESNTAIDKETISLYGYESSDRTIDERQFGQLVHQNMDEAATNSFYKPPPHEHDEQQIFGKEDSNDALERKRHLKDPDLEKAKIKYNKVVNEADIPTIDRIEDEGEQVNQSKNNKMELDSATDSYPEFPYSGQAMISVDMGGKPEVEKLYKDAGFKNAISKEANSVYDDESAFTDRARGERQLGQLVHQREQDKIDGAATVFYKPPPYESAGQHTIEDEDSDGANKINIQLLESDSENAILMDSNTDNDADVTTKTRNRDNGLQVNESKDDKMKAGTDSCHKSLLSENDKQQTISGQSLDKLEVEKQQKDAESKTGIWHDNNPVNEPESRNRDETRVRRVGLQVHQSKNDEMKLDIGTGSCYELSFDKHDGWQTSSSEDSKNKLGLEQHHKDAKSKLPIKNGSLTVYESTSTGRNKDERLIEKQVNESKENGMKLEDATGYFHKSSFNECGGQQAAKNEDFHDTIKPKTGKLAGNGGAIVKNQEASLMAGMFLHTIRSASLDASILIPRNN